MEICKQNIGLFDRSLLDVHHRPGNVHDSNGADAFIERCVRTVRESLPRAKIEVRIESAFFNQGIVERLHSLGVTFSVSVPFERFAELKAMIEGRQRWRLAARVPTQHPCVYRTVSSERSYPRQHSIRRRDGRHRQIAVCQVAVGGDIARVHARLGICCGIADRAIRSTANPLVACTYEDSRPSVGIRCWP